ncbi:MAG TPA: cupin domain-containing protein [Steroidobacteraceae bacterium]
MTMHAVLARAVALVVFAGTASIGFADMPGPMNPDELKWGPAPAKLPAGAQLAVLAGDPGGTGPATVRLKFPAGYAIPPHWHPTDEIVTVISGDFSVGMGDTVDKKHMKRLKPGGFGIVPATMHHYAWTKTGAIVQINLMAPFMITYVSPADDPTAKK